MAAKEKRFGCQKKRGEEEEETVNDFQLSEVRRKSQITDPFPSSLSVY